MTTEPIGKLLCRMAVPASTGLFFNTMFNVTDTFYTRFITPEALAGLGLSFPVYLMMIALGAGLGNAVQALTANALGSGAAKRGSMLGVSGLTLTVLLVSVVTVFGFFFLEPVLRLMGAVGSPLEEALHYSRVILGGVDLFCTKQCAQWDTFSPG